MTAAGSVAAVIVAAGRGLRAGGDLPKQWQRIAGRTVLEHTLARFRAHPSIDQIVLVVSADDMAHVEALGLADLCTLAPGGPSRAASVRSGLAQVAGAEKVLIHDAARCCLPAAVIDRVVAALDSQTAAAPALAVTDALWTGGGTVTGTTDRTGLWRAQTPQGFRLDAIRAAHAAFEGEAADDVEVARAAGIDVAIVAGDEDNLKITGPGDFARAARILEATLDIRTGTGYDVHRFGPGDHVMLCGVRFPHGRGLQGHSDADVGMHALTDAIYGALAEGDIGRHFPPSDPQWKGAESHIFLAHAARLARERGFAISNADVTLICEHPKIGPHAAAMRAALAQICGIEVGRVSVKATTSERLGFTGREEGIAAMAAVTLVSP